MKCSINATTSSADAYERRYCRPRRNETAMICFAPGGQPDRLRIINSVFGPITAEIGHARDSNPLLRARCRPPKTRATFTRSDDRQGDVDRSDNRDSGGRPKLMCSDHRHDGRFDPHTSQAHSNVWSASHEPCVACPVCHDPSPGFQPARAGV